MGLLPDDYYQKLLNAPESTSTPAPVAAPVNNTPAAVSAPSDNLAPVPVVNPNSNSVPSAPALTPNRSYVQNAPKPLKTPGLESPFAAMEAGVPNFNPLQNPSAGRFDGDISEADQIAKFGGPVGSQQYYDYLADNPVASFLPQQIMSSFGVKYPDQETWDKMTPGDQLRHSMLGLAGAAATVVKDLPRQIVRAPISFGYSIYDAWSKFAQGKTGWDDFKGETPIQVPWVGAVPSYWGSFNDARDSGLGPIASSVVTGSQVAGDIAIGASLADAVATGLRPRASLKPGETVGNVEPIKSAIAKEYETQQAKLRVRPANSPNEYYSLPKTTASKYGGNSGDTFLKISPAGEGQAEISVVQLRQGAKGSALGAIDYVKDKAGIPTKTYQGDFGKEVKLDSQVVPLQNNGSTAVTVTVPAPTASAPTAPVPGSDIKINQGDVKLYGPKGVSDAGLSMFGAFSEQGKLLAAKVPEEDLRGVGALAQSSDNIEVRQDARRIVQILSDRVEEAAKVQKLQDLKIKSVGTSEGNLLQSVIDAMLPKSVETISPNAPIPGQPLTPEMFGNTESSIPSSKPYFRATTQSEIDSILGGGKFGSHMPGEGGFTYVTPDKNYAESYLQDRPDARMIEFKPTSDVTKSEQGLGITKEDIAKIYDSKGNIVYSAPVNSVTEVPPFPDSEPGVPGLSGKETPITVPPAPLKGFENAPITAEQMANIEKIIKVNGIDPSIRDAVIANVTGKSAIGELTQTDYVKAVQNLALLDKTKMYDPSLQPYMTTHIASYASPQRYWMRNYELKTGLPLYTDGYVPMENAVKLRNSFRDSYRGAAREIFGKYAGSKFGEERRLITSYMEGNKAAIEENPVLTPETKADLLDISTKMRALYDTTGPLLGVPVDKFLTDYQPHIQNIGGVHQLYKEGSDIPKDLQFFAEFKRHGSTNIRQDDALALFDIYTNAGSNTAFLNPALERIAKLGNSLPETVKASLKSYVQEKMGYAGKIEQFLNNFGSTIGSKLGVNIPPDAVRQLQQLYMDTTYSGAMGLNPGSIMRNMLQYDLLTYPRIGPKFYGQALVKSLTKEGIKEVQDAGFLVKLGVPYGEELTKDSTFLGKAGNLYRKGTQATLEPFGKVEAVNRARTYFQVKMQFEDALSRYNSGQLTWPQFETALDFRSLKSPDRNIIRQSLVSGDITGAFRHLAREIIDETQFPYRSGASARMTYGLVGKTLTQFEQWPLEFAHTMGSWLKQAATKGDFSKIIRFWGASSAITRTLKDTFGFDFTKSAFLNPFNVGFSPVIKSAINFVDWLQAIKSNNQDQINTNAAAIGSELKSLGMPVGVEATNFQSFLKSYNAGPTGPNGTYPIFDSKGRLQYYSDFSNMFWKMLNVPTVEDQNQKNVQSDLYNAKTNYSAAKQTVLELYQQEKYDQANALIQQYGIQISSSDFDQYHIPLTQRTFESLPASLKGQFAPKVFQNAQ